ncbi:MAG: CBS domain-containing protein [Pseudomonadales bacterium]|nr:CBS domain-containing protein [Halioglobus sp.]MCP5131394.1 CBS domain-containing protein [Pseudomonadales bacterium]
MLTVAEIMTREPYSLGPDDTLAQARQLLAEHRIRHLPIVSAEGSLIGLVSQRDVLAAADSSVVSRGSGGTQENYVALSSIMTTPVHTTDMSASLRGAAMHLQKHKLGCLPVLNEGRLVGIITDTDFVAIAINLMEQIEAAEPGEDDFDDEDDGDYA